MSMGEHHDNHQLFESLWHALERVVNKKIQIPTLKLEKKVRVTPTKHFHKLSIDFDDKFKAEKQSFVISRSISKWK